MERNENFFYNLNIKRSFIMELNIRNKWISLGGSSTVTDKNENPVLKVKGKIFTFTRKKLIQDLILGTFSRCCSH